MCSSRKVPEKRAMSLYLSQGAHVGGAEAVGKAIMKREGVENQNWRQPALNKAFVAYTELLKMPSRCRRNDADWEELPETRRKALVDTLERRFVSQGLLAKWILESDEHDKVEAEVDLLNPSPECPTCRQRRPDKHVNKASGRAGGSCSSCRTLKKRKRDGR